MIDVHCHLNFHAFEKDRDEVIQRAFSKGIKRIINVGTKIDSSEKAVELAQQYEHLYAIVGVHPHHADKKDLNQKSGSRNQDGTSSWIEKLETLACMPKVVAVGEIGLDYFSYQSNGIVDPELQKDVFEQQIVLASKLKLPLQIHNRHAGKDILEILKQNKQLLQDPPGMFHCFAGTVEILKEALDLGFFIGFDGNLTYKGLAPGETVSLPDLVKACPLDRIVTETDSPFLTPIPHRGARNEPSYVIIAGEAIAKTKGIPFERVREQTTINAKLLFKLT